MIRGSLGVKVRGEVEGISPRWARWQAGSTHLVVCRRVGGQEMVRARVWEPAEVLRHRLASVGVGGRLACPKACPHGNEKVKGH